LRRDRVEAATRRRPWLTEPRVALRLDFGEAVVRLARRAKAGAALGRKRTETAARRIAHLALRGHRVEPAARRIAHLALRRDRMEPAAWLRSGLAEPRMALALRRDRMEPAARRRVAGLTESRLTLRRNRMEAGARLVRPTELGAGRRRRWVKATLGWRR
jgi:hypothetical protein